MASSLRGQTFVCHRSFITPRRGSDQTKLETGATGVIHDSRTVQGEVWVKVSSKSHGTGYVPLDHVTVGSALTVHVLENHPYKCAQSYNNPRLNTDEILLVVGTEGKLEQVKADGKWAIVTDPRSRPARRGVVPLNCLEVGMSRRFGDLDVNVKGVLGAFSYKSTITSLNVPATESLFGKHVSGLLRAYYDKRVVLGLADSMTQYIRNDHAVAQTTAFIVKGCQISQQLANLNNPQVVWRDIRNASSGPVKTPARPDVDDIPTWEDINKGEGFYALFYSVFRSDPSKKPNGYIGQATGFGHRWDNHKKRMYAPDNAHYRNALDAKAYKAVELCRVTKCPVDIKFVVEQVFIDTFGSYNPRVLRTPSAGLLAPAPTASQQSTAGTIAGQTQHYIDAVNLTQIARAVGEQTGWVPLFARPGFGADQGFNWASPITESVRRASMLWIKQRFPNGYTLYTRSVCKMAKSGVALSCLAIGSTGPTVKIELNAKDAKPFVQGDSVYPAFELAPEGVRHEHQYARVGRAGTSTDEADVARLAIKIVGYKDGAWHQIYVQSFHPWGDTRGEIGSFTGYAIVSGLLRYLRQQDNVDRRPYAKNYGVARVSEAAFDNMTQTYTLTPLHPTTKIPAPTLRSRDEIKADLMPHTTPYTRVGFSAIAGLQGRRSKCDGCHHVDKNQQGGGGRTEGRAQLICKKHSDFDSCEECVRFNRPCFVTPTEHLLGNDQLREALNGPKMRGQTAEIIEDPNIVASGADDEADDEAEEE